MNKIVRFIIIAFLFFAAQSFAATTNIVITDFKFTPNSVTINMGDNVKWFNNSFSTHTTTSAQSGLWNKSLNPGEAFSLTFNNAGTYNYKCTIHPSMVAQIVVRSAEQTRINTGKNLLTNIVPVPLNLTGKNANLAYLGSYIVNAQAGCANCHSCPTYKTGNNPYRGQPKKFNTATYLAGGVVVSGGGQTAVSANLTPNATGKPAGLTLNQFKNLLRTGHDPDAPGALLPVMPWPIFGMMSDYDLNAIYEYLRTIPRVNTPTTRCTQPGK